MTITYNSVGTPGKVCRRCCKWENLSFFSPKRERGQAVGDGYHSICKPCRNAAEMARYRASGEFGRARLREQYQKRKDKQRRYMDEYRRIHHDHIIAHKRAHWAANRDGINALRRERRAANREHYRAISRAYRASRRAHIATHARRYRAQHPDKIQELNRSYYQRFPSKFLIYANRRRALKAQAPGVHTDAEWQALKAYYQHTCLCCFRREPDILLTRDHVIPLDKGGSDDIANIQPLCKSCNSSKSTKSIDYRPSSSP